MWHRGGADEATAPARRSLQGPCRCEGSGVTSGEGEQLQEVWQDRSSVGKELRGRGPQKPSKRLKWAAPERWQGRETRPEFLERKLTPEQLGLEWCGSTYTWILFSTKYFRTTCSTENHGCRLCITYRGMLYYGGGRGWRPLPLPVWGAAVSESTALATGQLWEVKTRHKMWSQLSWVWIPPAAHKTMWLIKWLSFSFHIIKWR